jgi:uncharacterized protein YgiM (DUF1202 family)
LKKVFLLFVVIGAIFAYGYYSVSSKANNPAVPTSTAFLLPTQTPVNTCTVQTGIDTGRVNLRACPGTNCGVLSVLADGELLQVIGAGDWLKVQTKSQMTGYINSKFCKGQ